MKINIKNIINSRGKIAVVVIVALVLGLGSIPSRAPAQALGAGYFLNNTTLSLSGLAGTLVIEAGSNVDSLTTAGVSAFTVVMSAGQIFSIHSNDKYTFSNDGGYSTACTPSQSSLTISLGQGASSKTVVVTPSSTVCTQSSGSPGGGGGGSSGSAGGGGDSSIPTPTPTPTVTPTPVSHTPVPTPVVVAPVNATSVPNSSVSITFGLPSNISVVQGSALHFSYNLLNNSGGTALFRIVRDLISSSNKIVARYETSNKISSGKSVKFSPTQAIAAIRATGVYSERISIYKGKMLVGQNQFNFTVLSKKNAGHTK